MISSNTKNTDEPNQPNDDTQNKEIKIPSVDPAIQYSIDILNDIFMIQNESLDQGLLYLPDFLDEKINTIRYEPIRQVAENFLNFRKKLNESIEKTINTQPNKNEKSSNNKSLIHSHLDKIRYNFYKAPIVDINPYQNNELPKKNITKSDISTGFKSDYSDNNNNSTENESENDQSSTSSVQFYENYEPQPRQRSSSETKKMKYNTNTDNSNTRAIPPLSNQFNNDNKSDETPKISTQLSTPTQFFKLPSFSKGKSPFHFHNRERALSNVSKTNAPLFEPSSSSLVENKQANQFVNDAEKVKKISDSCLHPIPNFASICSTIETIDKTLSEFNKTKFDQFANTETRLKNITMNIQSFIKMSNRTKQNLKQIISESHFDSENDPNSSKSENEIVHIKKNIQSLLLLKEEQSKKIKQQTKEISYLRNQIESLKIFIKNNQKQISKFKQQLFNNLSTETNKEDNNTKIINNEQNKEMKINFHLKQRSKSIDFFNSFFLDDENENQLNDFCDKIKITQDNVKLQSKIKQIDQLLCTIDNENYEDNIEVELRLERLRERISKLYRIDEDQITKNWTFTCAEGAEIENHEIRSYFFEKQYSETQAKLLSLEKQRTKLFELFFSFSHSKKSKDTENKQTNDNDNDYTDEDEDEYISNSISESILEDLNEKNLIIEKKSKLIIEIKKEMENKNKNYELLNQKLAKQTKENETLIKKYEEISNKFSETEAQLSSSLKEIKSLNRKLNSSENKKERLEKQIQEIREKNKKNGSITEIKNISNSLASELSSVKLLADQQEEAINQLQQIKEQLEDELEATKEALKDSMTDIQEKTESLKLIEKNLEDEKENSKMKEFESSELKNLLEHSIEENDKLKETIKILTDSPSSLINDNEINQSNDENISIVSSLKRQIKILKEDNEKKEMQIKELNKKVLSSEPKLFTLKRKSLSQKNIINQLTAKTEEIKQLIETQYQTEIDQLSNKVVDLEYQLQNQTSNPNSLDINNENENQTDLNDEVSKLTKENCELKNIIKEMKQQNEINSKDIKIGDENNSKSIEIKDQSKTETSNTKDDFVQLQKRLIELEKEKSREHKYESIINDLLGENITQFSDEQLQARIEEFHRKQENENTNTNSVVERTVNLSDKTDDNNKDTNLHSQQEKEKKEAEYKNEISQLTSENNNLKQTTNDLSSQLENYKEQLKSSQTQLQTILQLISNESETKQTPTSKPLNDEEFSKIINEFQQIKSKANSSLQESTNNHQESQLQNNEEQKQKEEQKKIAIETKINQLTSENNSLSSQLESYKKQLQSSQTQLQTILQLISNDSETKQTPTARPLNDEEFSKVINEFQQIKSKANSTNNHQESQLEQKPKREEEQKKIEIETKIDQLTSENNNLKQTNNDLSSQLENYKEQLQSSQKKLQVISQMITDESNSETEQKPTPDPLNEEEFSNIINELQKIKTKINSSSSQESTTPNSHKNQAQTDLNEKVSRLTKENSELQKTIKEMKEQNEINSKEKSKLNEAINSESTLHKQKETKYQNEIIELTTKNDKLKETNTDLSAQLENCKEQLKSSQTQLRTIFEMVSKETEPETLEKEQATKETEQELTTKTESLKDEEFIKIIDELTKKKELNHKSQEFIKNNKDSNDENELNELRERISVLEIENEKLRILNFQKRNDEIELNNNSSQKVKNLNDSNSNNLPQDEYDDNYTICIPSLSKDYGYDSNRFSHDMSARFGAVSTANISTVFLPTENDSKSENVLSFGFVNFTFRSSDSKLFESKITENNECYYLKSQVIVTNLPFGIKKHDAINELTKFASSLSINLNESNFKEVFFENSINPEYLIDFKENVKGAKTFIEAIQNISFNQPISYHMSGYIPISFLYDPCPFKLNENRQKAINKHSSNARLIAMMEIEQFKHFDFNAYFNGLTNKSENDTIYSNQIATDQRNDADDQYRLIVDRRFIISDAYPQFKKLEVVFVNDVEAVLAQTYAMNYSCDLLQIFHANFKGNRIAGNDF